MEWTFDPLEIKNAHLNIARLGAICRRYQPDFYGPSSSPLQGGLPTDRLYAEWWLRSPHVERILSSQSLTPPHEPVVERIVVPHTIHEWKRDDTQRHLAQSLQLANREALQSAFARGLSVIGYERLASGDGCFLLGNSPVAHSAPTVTGLS
jgi:predicted GNAT superfamily acetyltransferase